jgi:hypothetical protein
MVLNAAHITCLILTACKERKPYNTSSGLR